MSSNHDITVFDSSGDIFLLLETNDDQSDRKSSSGYSSLYPPPDRTSTDEARAEEAQPDSIVVHHNLDSIVAQSSATSTREIVMQVSSKHLSLASKVFDNMFEGQSRDNVLSQDREALTIPLLHDNVESMQILLCIVHGLTRRVPRRVERSQLLQTVKVIDKYEFHEIAEVFTDMWFESLRPSIPRNLHKDLASWIYICWELKKPEEFETLTEIAVRETSHGLEDLDGIVAFWIIGERSLLRNDQSMYSSPTDKIQSSRQDILTKFLLILSTLLDQCQHSRRQCYQHPDCDALALGKLTQGLTRAGIFPVPEPSSLDRSIQELFSTVRAIDLPALCRMSTRKSRGIYYEASSQACHLDEELPKSLSNLEDSVRGLNINQGRNKEV
jgi:hypothetical protein